MRAVFVSTMLGVSIIAGCASASLRPSNAVLAQQVKDTEYAFAHTMAMRDHAAFTTFLAPETIFFSGAKTLRGSKQVADAWKPYYDGPVAPFSWQADRVEVLDSGTLALSTGPVHDSQGQLIGIFNLIWRLEAPGKWRIVFDKGGVVCGAKQE